MTKQTFRAVKLDTFPNQPIYRLTAEWAGLPAGTEVSPVSAGESMDGEHKRTVFVRSGTRKGETVTGQY